MAEIRVVTPDDWRVWRELRLAALAQDPYAFSSRLADWQGDGDREERWRRRLSTPGSYHAVAVLDQRAVGMAGGIPYGEPGVAELVSMWVDPAARGRGVGGLLVSAVVRWAGAAGARLLRLAVAEGNASAEALYERSGFRRTGQWELMPDGTRREWIMERPFPGSAA